MKRIIQGWLRVFGCLLLIGCGGGSGGSGPGDVVKRYVTALGNGETEKALNCIDPAKRKTAEPLIQFGAETAAAFVKSGGGIDSITVLNEDIQGDKARVGYQTKTKNGRESRKALNAEKINGTWYVAP